jgi:hypothetical protein
MKIDPRNIEVIDDEMVKVYKEKTGTERGEIALSIWRSVLNQLRTYLISMHPDWSKEKTDKEILRRLGIGT